ncbi:MAG TPA: HDOD domain-containing protein [Fibrobacteria bacterium]|nr:HDOD domain-containing protein [Fibrobacteria bacterium]HOX51000.1 HDOD domain-containing protein [Fibrobacteria bacterium]
MRFDVPEARILLVDDDEHFRSSLGESLRNYGFQVMEAGTSPSALEIATRRKPTICILETQLSGVDGLQFIKYLRSRHVFRLLPIIVVTRSITKDILAQLVRLGVHSVFVKPSLSFEQLIGKLLEISPMPDLFSPGSSSRDASVASHHESSPSSFDDSSSGAISSVGPAGADIRTDPGEKPIARPLTREDLQRLASLKALPVVIEDLVDTASRPTTSLEDLELVLRKDPVIASHVIRVANTAAYLRGAPVSRIDEALQLLGFKNVVRIALACGVVSKSELRRASGDDLREIWRNSLACAMVMERLSPKLEAPRNYALALLRNVPLILLVQHLETDWFAWRDWASRNDVMFDRLVEESCGLSLGQFVDSIVTTMNLPTSIGEPLREYFRFFMARERMEPGLVARKLDLVNQIAIILTRTGCDLAEVRCIHPREIESSVFLALTGAEFSKELDLLEASIGIMGGSDAFDGPRLGEIVVWRDSRWSPFDPIVSFIESFADCVTVNFVQDLVKSSRPAIAIAEPRTPEWEVLRGCRKNMVLLHSESFDPKELPPQIVPIRFPLPLRRLRIELEKALR